MTFRSNTTDSLARSLGIAASAALLASCGGGGSLQPRYFALHNTMTAMGFVQSGSIQQGSVAEGGETRLQVTVPAECSTFVVLGDEHVGDIDVVVRDATGRELARDSTHDAQAMTRFCPGYPGAVELLIRGVRGSGEYVVSQYVGGGGGGMTSPPGSTFGMMPGGPAAMSGPTPTARARHGGPGTCEEPWPLAFEERRQGDTSTGDATMTGSCLRDSETAPEHVYAIELEERSMVHAQLDSEHDGAVYLLGECGEARSELACNDDFERNRTHSEVRAVLDPGTYFVVVDGWGTTEGEYELVVHRTAQRSPGEMCASAPVLPIGQPISGTTADSSDSFQATCAGTAHSPDRVYALDVATRSRVRVRMQSTYDGALHLRGQCADATTEIACNDDAGDTRHSLVTATLDPGRYYVIADGYSRPAPSTDQSEPTFQSSQGDFTLSVDIGQGTGGAGDTCATATALTTGQTTVTADTFALNDDLSGSCGGAGAPDAIYRLDVRSRTRVRARLGSADFQGVFYLRSGCGGTGAAAGNELACAGGSAGGEIDVSLQPGTYYLVVDGENANAFGSATVQLQLDDQGSLDQLCRQAPLLRPGHQTTGDTTGQTDRFQATCGSNAQSGERVYRLELRRRSHVRISSEQTGFDGVLHIRSTCLDANTELGCNDDAGDTSHSMIDTVLEAGTYYVFMDGYGTSNQGPFTLDIDVQNP